MNDFEFWPWERLSPEVTDGQADLRGERNGIEWLFRAGGRLWFSRRADDLKREGHLVFCPVVGRSNRWDVRLETTWIEDEGPIEVLRDWSDEDLESGWFHVWRLSQESDGLHFVFWNEKTGWLYGNEPDFLVQRDASWPFRFDGPTPSDSSSPALYPLLEAQWREDSDVRFAARFAALSELDRALQGIETRIGTPFEFASLIQLALRAFAPQWPVDLETARLHFTANRGFLRFTLNESHPFGVRESAVLNHIVRAFEPRQLPDSPELLLCVRTLTEGGRSRSFSIEVARPSMHDRLEGMLELRAWLETHWPGGVKHLEKVV